MNRVSVIVRNPAYIEEAELDEDGNNPANLIPLVLTIRSYFFMVLYTGFKVYFFLNNLN